MSPRNPSLSLLAGVLVCWVAACSEEEATCRPNSGTAAVFAPDGGTGDASATSWLTYPFPADHRRTASGHVDFTDFPNPRYVDLLQDYMEYAGEAIDGFGTNSPVYLAFTAPIDGTSLPAGEPVFSDATSTLQLVDITPTSPEYGVRRPLRWQLFNDATDFVVANTLAVAPAWGFPLREKTTYALLLTDGVLAADGSSLSQPALLAGLLGDVSQANCGANPDTFTTLEAQFAPLRARLAADGIAPERVVAATVFTTQTITDELVALRQFVRDTLPQPTIDPNGWQLLDDPSYFVVEQKLWEVGKTVDFWVLEGRYESPNFQVGEIPYYNEGGHFEFVDGVPVVQRTETLRFVISLPMTAPPGGCHAVVQYGHGTTGDAYSFVNDGTAGRLAGRGIAAISLDQPFHGMRKEGRTIDEATMSFNFFNPAAARANFRQSTVDTFVLTRLLEAGLTVPANVSPTGSEICLEAGPSAFFGHSHGGLTGALGAAFEPNVSAWMLSGAGGGLSITLMERNDEFGDIKALMTLFLQIQEPDALSELHPATGLVQTLVEITDPINYSPFWLHNRIDGNAQNILTTSGLGDEATPHRTGAALNVAGRIPQLSPVAIELPAYEVAGVGRVSSPVQGNADGTHTAGFIQYSGAGGDASHFLVFRRPEAIHACMEFLRSATQGPSPTIVRDSDSDAR